MIELICLHGLDQADVVHYLCEMRQGFRNFRPGRSVFVEFVLRPKHRCVGSDKGITLPRDDRRRKRFACKFCEFRFVIEQIKLAWRARHEEMDDMLGLARKMWRARLEGITRRRCCRQCF